MGQPGKVKVLKVLVTGGATRTGALVVRALAERGHMVNALDLPTASFERIERRDNVKLLRGDLLKPEDIKEACRGMDVVLHLTEISPPLSEKDAARTMAINATGTVNLVEALESEPSSLLIFSSSVSVYGRTQDEKPPITADHPLQATDNYSRSKIEAESVIREGSVPYMILRVTNAYAAELFEFPVRSHPKGRVPFQADQRVEFMDRDDMVRALVAAVENPSRNRILNIAGGVSWRMGGKQFVEAIFDAVAVSGGVIYSPEVGYFDWYDTEESQRLLNYQRTKFHGFLRKVEWAFGYALLGVGVR